MAKANSTDTYSGDWRKSLRTTYEAKAKGNRFKLSEGTNVVRVLPGRPANTAPIMEYSAIGDLGPNKRFVACGADQSGGRDCWLCDKHIPKLEARGKRSKIKAGSCKPQMVLQVAYRNSQDEYEGPLPWFLSIGGPQALGTRLLGLLTNPKRDVVHPQKGFDIEIERTGSGLKTRYGTLMPVPESTPVPAKILKARKPLAEICPAYDEDYMIAAYYGREDELDREDPDDDDDDDAAPSKAVDPDEEEEESGTEAEEEEEEPEVKHDEMDPDLESDLADETGAVSDEYAGDASDEDLDMLTGAAEEEEEAPAPPPRKATRKVARKPRKRG